MIIPSVNILIDFNAFLKEGFVIIETSVALRLTPVDRDSRKCIYSLKRFYIYMQKHEFLILFVPLHSELHHLHKLVIFFL